jgi:hypothetical protein
MDPSWTHVQAHSLEFIFLAKASSHWKVFTMKCSAQGAVAVSVEGSPQQGLLDDDSSDNLSKK